MAMAESLELPGQNDFKWVPGKNASGIGEGANAGIITNFATFVGEDTVGWFGGTGQGHNQSEYNEISIASTANGFTFASRPALNGEYVALGVALTEAAESITLSFTTDKHLGYSLWSWDGTTATELVGFKRQEAADNVTATYTKEVGPSTIFAVWSSNPGGDKVVGGGTSINVSNISLAYEAAPAPVETLTAVTVNSAMEWYEGMYVLTADESLAEGSYTLGRTVDINISDAAWQTIVEGVGEGNQFAVTIMDSEYNFIQGYENVTFNMKGQTGNMLTDGTGGIGTFTATVPEPTTATLSLLALAGLAARRRRK